jgi:hypothetical protein
MNTLLARAVRQAVIRSNCFPTQGKMMPSDGAAEFGFSPIHVPAMRVDWSAWYAYRPHPCQCSVGQRDPADYFAPPAFDGGAP